MAEAITDDMLRSTMSRYAGLASLALDDPEAWLGGEDDASDPSGGQVEEGKGVVRRAGHELADRLRGDVHPGSPAWETRPAAERVDWWVDTVGTLTAAVAASPRFFGALADRLPVQGAFSVSSQGLAVCAAAREHGLRDPDSWVPLLGKVLFDRDLPRGAVGRTSEAGSAREEAEAGAAELGAAGEDTPRGPVRRAAGMVWRLGKTLLELQGLFDERPRGKWRYRALGKIPVVGVVGGFLDERGAVRKAADETVDLVRQGYPVRP